MKESDTNSQGFLDSFLWSVPPVTPCHPHCLHYHVPAHPKFCSYIRSMLALGMGVRPRKIVVPFKAWSLYYPLHIAAANDKSIRDTDRSELENKYKGALVRKNAAEKIKKTQDPRELPAYENIAKAIYSFMKNKRGPEERTFEEVINTSQISAQHNPWHGGALNDNDIERLLESVEWIFSTLKSLTTTD
jgi:hypothetical protein